jgi:hypothetical protein
MADQRIFFYDGSRKGKASFEVKTTMSDERAIELLTDGKGIAPDMPDDFNHKCAFEIHKAAGGFRASDVLLAWGFRNAEKLAEGPTPTVKLSKKIRDIVAFRKPLKGETDGHPYKVALCGPNSRHQGSYAITDGGPFREGEFYGYAKKAGRSFEWTPRRETPEALIAFLTK